MQSCFAYVLSLVGRDLPSTTACRFRLGLESSHAAATCKCWRQGRDLILLALETLGPDLREVSFALLVPGLEILSKSSVSASVSVILSALPSIVIFL